MMDSKARQDEILGHGPRIKPLPPEQRSEAQKALIARSKPPVEVSQMKGASDTEWVEIMAHHDDLFGAHMVFAMKLMTQGALSPRDRELAVLRLAWVSGAPFEWGGHVMIAKACGVSGDEIESVIDGPGAACWSAHDSSLLQAAEELHQDSMISDATWAILAETFDERQLIELVMLIGHYKTVAYYQNALRFRLPDGNEGLNAR